MVHGSKWYSKKQYGTVRCCVGRHWYGEKRFRAVSYLMVPDGTGRHG